MSIFQGQGVANKVDYEPAKQTRNGPKPYYTLQVDNEKYGWWTKGQVQLNEGDQMVFTFKQNHVNGKVYNNIDTVQTINGQSPVPVAAGQAPAPQAAPVAAQPYVAPAPAAPPRPTERRGDSVGMAIKCACETLGECTLEDIEARAKDILLMGDRLRHYKPSYELEWLKGSEADSSADDAAAFQAA